MARSSTRDTDRGFAAIVAQFKKAAKSKVEIGWFPDAEHGSLRTAELATIHEYGAPSAGIPARPMLAPVVDSGRENYRAELRRLWDEVLARRMTIEGALTVYGARIAGDVKKWIAAGTFVPLKPSTIARKGSSRPLIDTGAMRDQVEARVTIGKAR